MKNYKTDNLYVACYLLAKGYNDYTIDKNGSKAIFIFNYPIEKLLKEEEDYWKEEGVAPAKKLFMAYKELKTRISSLGFYVYDKKQEYMY